MGTVEDTEHVMAATGADWRTAAKALADAKKALKPKEKGIGALGKGPTEEQVMAKALELMKEPARLPANIAAIEALKKELKLSVAKCRAAMVEVDYDVHKARALLQSAAGAPAKRKTAKVDFTTLVTSGCARGDDIVLEVCRRKKLTKEEKAAQKELHRNGEYVGHVEDRCLVRRRDGQWSRVAPLLRGGFVSFALAPDGRLVYVTNHQRKRDQGGGYFCRVTTVGDDSAPTDIDGSARGFVLGDAGAMLRVKTSTGQPECIWAKRGDSPWSLLEFSPSSWDQTPSCADGTLWISTSNALFRLEGDDWVEVPHEVPNPKPIEHRPFEPVVVGPNGAIAGRNRGLWVGTRAGLARAISGDMKALAYVGSALVYDLEGSLYWRDAANERRIREPDKGGGSKPKTPVWFASDTRLFAATSTALEEWTGAVWEETSLDAMWSSIVDEQTWWTTKPPDWFPASATEGRLP